MSEIEIIKEALTQAESVLTRCQIEIIQLRSLCNELAEALELYADEGFYHGITILADRPTGGFDEDISLDEGSDYDYPKPGKAARAALARYHEAMK